MSRLTNFKPEDIRDLTENYRKRDPIIIKPIPDQTDIQKIVNLFFEYEDVGAVARRMKEYDSIKIKKILEELGVI